MMTLPPAQDIKTDTPKTGFDLSALKHQLSLAEELIRNAEERMNESQGVVAKSQQLLRRARQIHQAVQARKNRKSQAST